MNSETKWKREGTQILKNNIPVFLSGVAYSPTPCGGGVFQPGVGDWFAPPWNEIWERDFPLMKAAGIDNIRTYFFWAWSPPANMRNWQSVVEKPVEFDHKPFLDAAAHYGISVTIGIALDGGNIFNNPDMTLAKDYLDFYKTTAQKLAELYGNHPAVMGFCIANEQNTPERIVSEGFWNGLEEISAVVKQNAPDKLVMMAMQNDPAMFDAIIQPINVSVPERFAEIFDAWGLNVYAGMKTTLQSYQSKVVSTTKTALPCIISEWGIPGGKNVPEGEAGPPDGDATARQLTPEEFVKNIQSKMDPDGEEILANTSFVAGAQFFEWTDEWWKNNATPVYIHSASASPDWPEEWWGLNSITPEGRTAEDGPWNSKENKPYPADKLVARPTLNALTQIYSKAKQQLQNLVEG